LLIYVSSGMTIRNSIIKIADDYKQNVKNKIEKENIVFDKLCEAKNNLSNGELEAKVYEKIAKDLSDRKYSRFFNILIQNIKNGSKDFRNILSMEAYDSLQEKKSNAKKLGEEAATKLIIPLLLELMIVMFVIIVPAFMGM
ncbi:MAG: hypothetical protein MJ151_03435, partial [Lachnospiraceae bacterium]|nr:hypothetical protein [Lachnospiraceae bacterium]